MTEINYNLPIGTSQKSIQILKILKLKLILKKSGIHLINL